jgi:flagellar hook-associated protein 1 FlgK
MGGIGSLLDIGRSALLAYQRALSVTGQNISNVNTPGYSRQEVLLGALPPQDDGTAFMGMGVTVQEIRRSFDGFIARQLYGSQSTLGRYQVMRDALAQAEGFFPDSSDAGISAGMSDFFNALQDVANNPADLTARSVLLARAQTLAGRFNDTAGYLQAQQRALDGQIQQSVGEVNTLAAQIAALNAKIGQAESGGQAANDLRDQRESLLRDLASRINITTLEDGAGQITVFVGRGQTLVSQGNANRLIATPDANNHGYVDVQFVAGATGTPVTISSVIADGRLRGLLDVRDGTLAGLLSSLDTLAGDFVTQINQVHRQGFGLDGSTDLAFFAQAGLTASTMAVNISDPRQVAASASASGLPGDNANILAMAALQSQTSTVLGGVTLNDFYAKMTTDLGTAASQADQGLTVQTAVQAQLQSHQAEVAGVSLDEELMNLMKYQRAFEAASKVIVTTDALMQAILAMKQS